MGLRGYRLAPDAILPQQSLGQPLDVRAAGLSIFILEYRVCCVTAVKTQLGRANPLALSTT